MRWKAGKCGRTRTSKKCYNALSAERWAMSWSCVWSKRSRKPPFGAPSPRAPEDEDEDEGGGRTRTRADEGALAPRAFCEDCELALGKNLLQAVEEGSAQEVRRLLDSGADANFTFESEWTPLLRAASRACPDVVQLLVQRGANYHARTCCGFTALHMAACKDPSGRCVSILLNAGSYVDIWNEFRRTPLHYAAECGNEAAVRALVAAGASKSAKDEQGHTPFDVAKNGYIRRLLRRI